MTKDSIQGKPFEVQAGKRYVREDGLLTGTLIIKNGSCFDPLAEWYYQRDGATGGGDKFPNLVSEYPAPTAEPQDEWGPWQTVESYDDIDGPDIQVSMHDGQPISYRVKKEPVVCTDFVWIDKWGDVYEGDPMLDDRPTRQAIITMTDGKLSIDWVDP